MRIMHFPIPELLYRLVTFICGKDLTIVMRYLIYKWFYWLIVLPFVGLVFYGLWERDWLLAGSFLLLLLIGHITVVEDYRIRRKEQSLYRMQRENSQRQ